ncbi:polyphosphate kinase 2 [Devosia insulae DS-56]|uniref:ADP/GDP-polyphosphate phosphotransferase n=1 Tax=Devosia insulae DS-56 TaxID=1116389 RepID=A0A1E5XWI0_9HYPH|nr:polyphosphate kinase 2 [Devosia insulae]OEO32943.1 polyphosphate kinase 2 [Devosia insulae DS-56]
MSNALEGFDLEDPVLPRAIKKKALESGGFPYDEKLDSEIYDTEMLQVQRQLALLQHDQQKTGKRIVIVFEGRDAAGKGGSIASYLENLNPRYNMSVALPKPSDRERTQWYFQRYVDWMPAAGEQVLFDRSWYNRAGVEPVMGFCTPEETTRFLEAVPDFEKMLVEDGIHLFKFWLTIGREMQLKRFHDRRHDPLKVWKLSPIDLEALKRFDDYTKARNRMLEASHTEHAPWRIVFNNDKKRGRLGIIRSVLQALSYEGKDDKLIGAVDGKIVVDPQAFMKSHSEM